jgi:hypothetical protein
MKDAKINNLQQINNMNFASCDNILCRNMLGNKMNAYAVGSVLWSQTSHLKFFSESDVSKTPEFIQQTINILN